MKKILYSLSLIFFISQNAIADEQSDIKNTLTKEIDQLTATWNKGDINSFVKTYKDSDTTRYITSIETDGYKNILAQYKKRYSTPEKMGQLTISDLEIIVLSTHHAMVIGKWKVAQKEKIITGIFTLLYENTPAGWKIIIDHTS
jgi:ketosteroid isomerase-like protein